MHNVGWGFAEILPSARQQFQRRISRKPILQKKKLRNRISTAKLLTASGRKYERLERIKGFNKTKLRPRALLEFVNGSAAFRISLHSFTCFYKRR